MNLNLIIVIYNESMLSKITDKLYLFLKNSFTLKFFNITNDVISSAYINSSFKSFFEKENCSINDLFKNAFILLFLKEKLMNTINKLIYFLKLLFINSVIVNLFKELSRDICNNTIRYSCYILFCWLTLYSILKIILGTGFLKSEVEIIIILSILFFIFTRSEINLKEMLEDSFFIKWIKAALS